jgi:hypothetical protein
MAIHSFISNAAIRAYLQVRVEQGPGSCWLWTGNLDRRGYGLCWANGKQYRAARLAYIVWIGEIPPGHDVHHTCQIRRCINPTHFQALPRGRHMKFHSQLGVWAGSRNSKAKLSEKDVQFIRVAAEFVSVESLARQFGVSVRTIYYARSGRTWPDVDSPNFPPTTLAEGIQQVQAAIKQSLQTFLTIRADCQESQIPEPLHLDEAITKCRLCLGH